MTDTKRPGSPAALPISLLSRRGAVAALAAAAVGRPYLALAQGAPRVRLLMDWAFQAPNAFALRGAREGLFPRRRRRGAGRPRPGSGAVPPQLAGGAYDMGYRRHQPGHPLRRREPGPRHLAVAVLHDRTPLCAIVRADGPIRTPKDLEGKRLAAPDFDAGRQLFPAFARAAGIDASQGHLHLGHAGAARAHAGAARGGWRHRLRHHLGRSR